jgi:hypothetical protein
MGDDGLSNGFLNRISSEGRRNRAKSIPESACRRSRDGDGLMDLDRL